MTISRFSFLAGLARSGSTLITALLEQHPKIHTTGTSIVLDHILQIKNSKNGATLAYDLSDEASQAWGMMRGLLNGAYEQVEKGKIVLEKNRRWTKEIPALTRILGEKPKIIAVVRPIPEIISSFILLSKGIGTANRIDKEILSLNKDLTNCNRAAVIWEKYIYPDWRAFKVGYEENHECFCLIDYNELVTNPKNCIDHICTFLDLDPFDFKVKQLSNPNPEKDGIYGLPGLHYVRGEIKRVSPPAEQILGEKLYDFWVTKDLEFWN